MLLVVGVGFVVGRMIAAVARVVGLLAVAALVVGGVVVACAVSGGRVGDTVGVGEGAVGAGGDGVVDGGVVSGVVVVATHVSPLPVCWSQVPCRVWPERHALFAQSVHVSFLVAWLHTLLTRWSGGHSALPYTGLLHRVH